MPTTVMFAQRVAPAAPARPPMLGMILLMLAGLWTSAVAIADPLTFEAVFSRF